MQPVAGTLDNTQLCLREQSLDIIPMFLLDVGRLRTLEKQHWPLERAIALGRPGEVFIAGIDNRQVEPPAKHCPALLLLFPGNPLQVLQKKLAHSRLFKKSAISLS